MTQCWCGNNTLAVFSDEYARCPVCETLIWHGTNPAELAVVPPDETTYYGKDYFLDQQTQRGLPDLYSRARTDLTDRCPYWLKTLLRHRPPPARLLEIGSSHGAYVALLNATGYAARGLELSPWVVDFARAQFEIPVEAGTIDQVSYKPGSFDIIVMNDVAEHLPDPLSTFHQCARLLAPGGLLVVQTPRYPEGASLEELHASGTPFIKMLLPREHLFLFSRPGARELCRRAGLPVVLFEPAYFDDQDMFFLASTVEWNQTETKFLARGAMSRLVQALLDLHAARAESAARIAEIETDRADRLAQIMTLTSEVRRLEVDLSITNRRAAELERIPSWLPRWLIHRAARFLGRK